MKTVYKGLKIFLLAMCICLVLDSCANSRYGKDGRYRPRKSKKCSCPAYKYGYHIDHNAEKTLVLSQQKKS